MKHQTNESELATQLHQFAHQQIETALDYATNSAHDARLAVHETRRCLKRLRALLRLVRAAVGDTIYDRDQRYLRDLGQRLAALRDATAMQQTLDSLQNQAANALSGKSWRAFKKGVRGRQPRAEQILLVVAAKLKVARSRIMNWPLETADESLLRKALRKSYRQGRRARKVARVEPQPEHLHEWRKRVNQLRHQLRILQIIQLVTEKEPLQRSRALVEALGTYNDLAVLAARLSQLKVDERTSESQTLTQLIQTAQTKEEATAKQLGAKLYRHSAKAFLKALSL
ncbi:MAG: CHAD domain-containing protein [Blastocatellia bacterium]